MSEGYYNNLDRQPPPSHPHRPDREGERRSKRANRFEPPPPPRRAALVVAAAWGGGEGEADAELDFTVRGTNEAVEKQFLRLTSAPDPATVRPERVLVKSFAHVCERVEKATRARVAKVAKEAVSARTTGGAVKLIIHAVSRM
ncbi:hypothetical protein T492DRAFT_341229 [Pavlovales sp. CCMP2436]|nr:hypothetical protein T492DRAFT_341229 [Pavlovales sp. CCMP2436]